MGSNLEIAAYIGFMQSTLLALALGLMPEGNATSNRLLAGLLLASGCYLLIAGIGNRPELITCSLNELFSWIALSFGPLLWLYVRSVTHVDFKFGSGQCLHFLPVLPCLLLIVYDMDGMQCDAQPDSVIPTVITLLVIFSMLAYSLLALDELTRYRRDIREVVSTVEWKYVVWLRLFIFAIFAYIAFGVVGAVLWEIQAIPLLGAGLRVAVFNYLLFYLIIAVVLFQPEIFSRRYRELLRLKEQRLVETDGRLTSGSGVDGPKYERSGVSAELLNDYWERANQHLHEEQLYLQPDLRISVLADSLDISINHLSQAINAIGSTSFYDMINNYRIERARALLSDHTQDYKSVIEIGMDSGFNSQSAFYKAFNRVEGTTPAKYRKSRR